MNKKELLKEAKKSYELEKFDEAFLYLDTLFEIEESNYEGLLLVSEILFELGDYKIAIEYMEKAYKYYKNDLDVIYKLAYLYQITEKRKKALLLYEEYVKTNPTFYTFVNMSLCCKEMKHYKKALFYAEKAIEINPKIFNTYICKAECYKDMKKYDEVIKILNWILENKNKLEEVEEYLVYMFLGECYFHMKDIEKAINYFNISINSEDINSLIPYEKFTDLLLLTKRYDEMELLLINYKNSNFPKEYGLLLERKYANYTNQYERIIKISEKMIEIYPYEMKNYFYMIYSYKNLNNYDKALEILNLIKKNIDKSLYLKEKREILKNKKDYEKNL